jgi:hypothetical protein
MLKKITEEGFMLIEPRHVSPVVVAAFQAVEPPPFRDHPESSLEVADIDVDDTIGGE